MVGAAPTSVRAGRIKLVAHSKRRNGYRGRLVRCHCLWLDNILRAQNIKKQPISLCSPMTGPNLCRVNMLEEWGVYLTLADCTCLRGLSVQPTDARLLVIRLFCRLAASLPRCLAASLPCNPVVRQPRRLAICWRDSMPVLTLQITYRLVENPL